MKRMKLRRVKELMSGAEKGEEEGEQEIKSNFIKVKLAAKINRKSKQVTRKSENLM